MCGTVLLARRAVCGTVLLASACAPAVPQREGTVRRLRVVAAEAVPEGSRNARTFRRIDVPADALSRWSVQGAEASVVDASTFGLEAGERVLLLRGATGSATGGAATLAIDDRYPAGTFRRVVVRASSRGEAFVRVGLRMPEGHVVDSGASRRLPQARLEPSVLVFDIGARAPDAPDATSLVLSMTADLRNVLVHSIDLMELPLAACLPDPQGEPALVDIRGEQRRAVGLTDRQPLVAEAQLGTRAVLRCSYGVPPGVLPLQWGAELKIHVEAAGRRPVERRFELGPDPGPGPQGRGSSAWREVQVPLPDFAGERVRARFELIPAAPTAQRAEGDDAIVACALADVRMAEIGTRAPTVLLVTLDTQRADHVAAQGSGVRVDTPALDALASRGVFFEDCFSTTNVTTPSHVSLMTGVVPRDTGIVNNQTHLAGDAPTLAESFRDAGWLTYAAVGVRALGVVEHGLGQGFDRVSAPSAPTRDAEVSLRVLDEWLPDATGQPLFVWLHLFDAHAPYEPPGAFDRRYYPRDRDPSDEALAPSDPGQVRAAFRGWTATVRDLQYPVSQYAAEVAYSDEVLSELFEHPRFAQGVIAVTADHGESLGEHGVYWDHTGMHPKNLHVPLIVAGEGAPAGLRVAAGVQNHHVGRTVLDLAGLQDVEFAGHNLLEVEALDAPMRRARFGVSANWLTASLSEDGWHLMLNLRLNHRTQLYDLRTDPLCARERSAEEPDRASRMRAKLIAWLAAGQAHSWSAGATQEREILDELAQLGYATTPAPERELVWIEPDCDCTDCAAFRD